VGPWGPADHVWMVMVPQMQREPRRVPGTESYFLPTLSCSLCVCGYRFHWESCRLLRSYDGCGHVGGTQWAVLLWWVEASGASLTDCQEWPVARRGLCRCQGMKPPGHPSIVLSRSQCPSESPGSLPNNFRERVGPRILLKSTARVGAWWYTLVIPATWEAEVGGS
jgi:hypothetical protein